MQVLLGTLRYGRRGWDDVWGEAKKVEVADVLGAEPPRPGSCGSRSGRIVDAGPRISEDGVQDEAAADTIEDEPDEALEEASQARRMSKSALIIEYIRERILPLPPIENDPLMEMVGVDDYEPVSVAEVVYH